MRPAEELRKLVENLDGKDYGAYQFLKGSWDFRGFTLYIDKIPKDPYAPPHSGVYRVRVNCDTAGFDKSFAASGINNTAFCDFLTRAFHHSCDNFAGERRGTGNSGVITIAKPGQEILERTSVVANNEFIEARFFIGLPASGRRVNAKTAVEMLLDDLPKIVESSLLCKNLDNDTLALHIATAQDAEFLRGALDKNGLVAFIADGAILPRRSGVDPGPLDESTSIKFESPETLRKSFDLPNKGAITGMGVPRGVTLIVGGGFHGKSTLLQAIELGVYNHIPGDGREYCVTCTEAVKIRATSGRSVVKTDISSFIKGIPNGGDTSSFSSSNASGSTSQAAFLAESIEVDAKLLLMDEDTCATNFMFRDRRMQELVAKKDEPITTFVDRVRELFEERNISTILVMGGSGDYFDVADNVIQMTEFEPSEVTLHAHEIAKSFSTDRSKEGEGSFNMPRKRAPLSNWIEPKNEYGHFRISAPAQGQLIFGKARIDLSDLPQIVDFAQTKAIGLAIYRAIKYMDGTNNFGQVIEKIVEEIDQEKLDVLDKNLTGDIARFRGIDFASVLNRMRDLEVI